jgi:hypothetical protein
MAGAGRCKKGEEKMWERKMWKRKMWERKIRTALEGLYFFLPHIFLSDL